MNVYDLEGKSIEYAMGYIHSRTMLKENKSLDTIEKMIYKAREKRAELAEGLEAGLFSALSEDVEVLTDYNKIDDKVLQKMLKEYEDKNEINPWMQLQFILTNMPKDHDYVQKAEAIYREMEDKTIDMETAVSRLNNIVLMVQDYLWGKDDNEK